MVGGKAAVGDCTGVVINRIPLFATCTGTEGKKIMMNEVMVNDDAMPLQVFSCTR